MTESDPLVDESTRAVGPKWRMIAICAVLFALGAALGVLFAPSSPSEAVAQITGLRGELQDAQKRIDQLEREKATAISQGSATQLSGKLTAAQKKRHAEALGRYIEALRRVKAQPASELVQWFVARWEALLDHPQSGDRVSRRAELLVRLIGGMGEDLDPEDYIPWQAEFWSGDWLAEINVDDDGDGMPGLRSDPNPKDGFTQAHVCAIAMAINQTTRDAQILFMPEMKCNRADQRMSIFLAGATRDDAVTEYIKAMREEGYAVVDQTKNNHRLVLVGPRN